RLESDAVVAAPRHAARQALPDGHGELSRGGARPGGARVQRADRSLSRESAGVDRPVLDRRGLLPPAGFPPGPHRVPEGRRRVSEEPASPGGAAQSRDVLPSAPRSCPRARELGAGEQDLSGDERGEPGAVAPRPARRGAARHALTRAIDRPGAARFLTVLLGPVY